MRNDRRGTTLIEILVAMAITALLVIGVLQIFSLSLLQNQGASTRTQLTYKCQQVVEVLRLSQYLSAQGRPAFATAFAIDPSTWPTTNKSLPYTSSDAGWSSSPPGLGWGPAGANVVERENDAYRLLYTVEALGTAAWLVRVTALPVDSPGAPTGASPARRFFGKASRLKRVDYVAQIPR